MELFKKNPVNQKEYKTDSWFRILEARGDWFVFRRQVSSYIVPGESAPRPTIDIVLVGAMFIELPMIIEGFTITKPRNELSKKFSERYDKGNDFLEAGERTYSIETNGNRHHIVTSNLWIHVHNQQLRISPLDYLGSSDLDKHNYYYENFVEEWIKID